MDNYPPCPCVACIIQLSKQLQGSLSCSRTALPAQAHEICILAHGGVSCLRRGGATDCMSMRVELVKMFSTREEIDGKREPRVSRRGGDRRRAVLDSFEQLQIDFQAKHICIRKTVLRAIRVSRGMCALNRWVIFLELSCRNFSPLNRDLGHYSICFYS